MIRRGIRGLIFLRAYRAGLAAVLFAAPASFVQAQAVRRPANQVEEAIDSADVLGRARRQQSRFEQRRTRFLPLARGSSGGSCDEHVGRFCVWYDEGEWAPEPEVEEVVDLREQLLAYLDSVHALLPGDDWMLGQRVWYRAEVGRWEEALAVARECPGNSEWWCAALEGLSLHGMGRFGSAAHAFGRALEGMDPEEAREWRLPRRALDGDARDFLDDEDPMDLGARLDRLWTMADPLYLAPGNDRLTAHYARWTVSTLREKARNPFHIPWGGDLEQLTIRHGWELGWERGRPSPILSDRPSAIGHKHPEGRDFMPAGKALTDPAGADPTDLLAGTRRPRSLYAPRYAPVLLPLEGQVAVFPREDRVVVVATHYLPEDTTWHARHDHARPWMDPGGDEDAPDAAGLFLMPVDGSASRSITRRGDLDGASMLGAPAGSYVLSVEAWSPSRRRAGRHREGIRNDTVPPDVATLSDLLLVEGGGSEPSGLEEALGRALVRPWMRGTDGLGVVWEIGGLGWRPERVEYRLSVERVEGGLIRWLGRALRVVGRRRPLSLEWAEPGPERPERLLRWVDLELPELDAGVYRVLLEADIAGRTRLAAETGFRVR
jgi:tetratricopeptide (TPR) repeat protein